MFQVVLQHNFRIPKYGLMLLAELKHLRNPCSSKIQNGDILVQAYPGWPGKWPLKSVAVVLFCVECLQ